MKNHIVDCAACDEGFKGYLCALHSAAPELLAIVKAIAESFNAGAYQVYAEALAPHTDDETLQTWMNNVIAKAGGK